MFSTDTTIITVDGEQQSTSQLIPVNQIARLFEVTNPTGLGIEEIQETPSGSATPSSFSSSSCPKDESLKQKAAASNLNEIVQKLVKKNKFIPEASNIYYHYFYYQILINFVFCYISGSENWFNLHDWRQQPLPESVGTQIHIRHSMPVQRLSGSVQFVGHFIQNVKEVGYELSKSSLELVNTLETLRAVPLWSCLDGRELWEQRLDKI